MPANGDHQDDHDDDDKDRNYHQDDHQDDDNDKNDDDEDDDDDDEDLPALVAQKGEPVETSTIGHTCCNLTQTFEIYQ